jgi:hypothetical protein
VAPAPAPSSPVTSCPASPLPSVQGLSLSAASPHPDVPSPPLASSSSSTSPTPSRPLEQWLTDDSVTTKGDEYVEVRVWTSPQHSTAILYPTSRLRTMGSDTMPHHDVFQQAESLSAKERQGFWCGEGGEHMVRFNSAEQHQCHLVVKMWDDFRQLDTTSQEACQKQYVSRTYECLSKARNPTRVIRQLQSFAHFACGGGETYIEPSKFIQCPSEIVSERDLFKKLVQKVLKEVEKSRKALVQANNQDAKSRTRAPSARVLDQTTLGKQRVRKALSVTTSLCESVAKALLAEHPLIDSVESAEVHDGLPSYTINSKGTPSEDAEEFSYDALVVRKENRSLLTKFNNKWRKDVVSVGAQVNPATKERSATVTWKSDSKAVTVIPRFFEVVGWSDYYHLISPSILGDDDEGSALATPPRPVTPSFRHSFSLSSQSSFGSATPVTPAEKAAQKMHELVDRVVSSGASLVNMRALLRQLEGAVEKMSSMSSMETEQDSGSDSEDEEKDGNVDKEVDSNRDEDTDQGEDDEDAGDEDGALMEDDDAVEGDDSVSSERTTRSSKRKADIKLAGKTRKRAQRRLA